MLSLLLTWKKLVLEPSAQEMAREHTIPDVVFLFNSHPDSKKVVMGKGKEAPQRKVFGGIGWHGAAPLGQC